MPSGERKSIIFFIHGFGSYIEAHSAFLMQIAQAGHEIFAIDQRGYGESEGQRGIIEKAQDVYDD